MIAWMRRFDAAAQRLVDWAVIRLIRRGVPKSLLAATSRPIASRIAAARDSRGRRTPSRARWSAPDR